MTLAIALMVMDKRLESFVSIRAALTLPLAPLQYIVSAPAQFIDSIKSALSTHDGLVKENLQLKAEQLLVAFAITAPDCS